MKKARNKPKELESVEHSQDPFKRMEVLNTLLLDSLPHFAMVIRKDRTVLVANHLAREVGVKVGDYCWYDFGQSDFIPEKDKEYINEHHEIPPGGTCCYFCLADECLRIQKPVHNPEISAWDKIWDTYWIPLNNEMYLHYAIDVTSQRQAEQALRESEQTFKDLVEITTDWVWEVDKDGIYTYASPKVRDLLGYEQEEVIGRTPFDLMPAEEAEKTGKFLKEKVANSEPFYQLENINRHKDGHLVVLETSGIPLFDDEGNLKGYRGIARDITERKKSEQELLFKTTLLEAQSETSIDGILVVEQNGKTISFNKRFGQMWNIPQQLLETKDDKQMLRHAVDQLENPDKFLKKVEYLYAHKNEKSRDEIAFKDGRVFDRYSSALIDSSDTYHGRIWYFRDITEHKKNERQILKLNEELEQRVKERTAKLLRTHEHLREEIEERKRLEKDILDISEHEKRLFGQELHDAVGQQLAGIGFMAKVLEDSLAAELPEKSSYAGEIAELVTEAITKTRSIAKGLHPVDLDSSNLMLALRDLAESTSHMFEVSCTFNRDKPIQTNDDAVSCHVYRIAQEAITNAIKHGNAKNIQLILRSNQDKIVLTVRNDGKDFVEKTSESKGIGLRIMKYRAEMIEGRLYIRRGRNGGTVVTCSFPKQKTTNKEEREHGTAQSAE